MDVGREVAEGGGIGLFLTGEVLVTVACSILGVDVFTLVGEEYFLSMISVRSTVGVGVPKTGEAEGSAVLSLVNLLVGNTRVG